MGSHGLAREVCKVAIWDNMPGKVIPNMFFPPILERMKAPSVHWYIDRDRSIRSNMYIQPAGM